MSEKLYRGAFTGCYDRADLPIHEGQYVKYHLSGPHTKREYWDPIYRVVFVAPCFSLEHVAGGKDGGSHHFKLRHGGGNGDLEIVEPPKPDTSVQDQLSEAFDLLKTIREQLLFSKEMRNRIDDLLNEEFRT